MFVNKYFTKDLLITKIFNFHYILSRGAYISLQLHFILKLYPPHKCRFYLNLPLFFFHLSIFLFRSMLISVVLFKCISSKNIT